MHARILLTTRQSNRETPRHLLSRDAVSFRSVDTKQRDT